MKGLCSRGCLWTVTLLVALSGAWGQAPPPGRAKVDAATKKLMAATGFLQRGMFKPALQEYEEFLKAYPNHPAATDARYGQAVCYYRLGQYDQAAKTLEVVLKDPKFQQRDEALIVLGHCGLSTRAYKKALAAFDELLRKHPTSQHAGLAALNRAEALYLLNRNAESLKACQDYLKKHPNSPLRARALYYQGLAQEALGQHDQAAKVLRRLLADAPNSPYRFDAMLLLGQCLEGQNKLKEAAAQYRELISKAPPERQAEAIFSLGVVLYRNGQSAAAIKQLSTVLARHGKSPYAAPARLQLGLAQLAAGKTAQARKTLKEVLRLDPARAVKARYWLAQCDMAEGKHQAARTALAALAKLKPPPPNLPAVLYDHALCTMELGQHAQAAKEFAAFRRKYPKDERAADATYRQAFCLHKLGKYAESLTLCNQARGAAAVAAAAEELAAENLFLLGRYAEAQKAYTALAKSAKTAGDKLRYTFRLGQCAYFTGDNAKAIKLLQTLAGNRKVQADPELREALFLLGDALLQAEKYADAAKALGQYLAAGGGTGKLEARFKLALAQLHSQQRAAAEKTFAAVMNAGPANSPWVLKATFEYGQLAYLNKQPAKAAPALAKVLAAPNVPAELAAPAMCFLGWIELDAGRHAQAAERFGQMVAKFPKHPLAAEAAFQQAVCLREAGRPAEALRLFQAYCKAHPNGKHVRQAKHLMASCLSKLARHEEAKKLLAELAGRKTAEADGVLYELAWAQRSTKDTAAAIKTYRKLLTQYPKSKLVTAARAELAELLYQQEDYAAAAELLRKALADAKADPEVLAAANYRLGWCYARLQQHAKAAETFSTFLGRYGKHALAPSAMYQAGQAYALAGKAREAAAYFSRLLAAYPKDKLAEVTHLKLGEAQNAAGDFQRAATTFTTFLKKYPKSKFFYLAQFGMGWAMENLKKYDLARNWYAKVIEKHNGPTAARAQFQIGETYFAQGKLEQAAAELIKVDIVYNYPDWSARALCEAGRAYEALGQVQAAKKQYAECLRKYPKQPATKLAESRLKVLAGQSG